MEHRAADTSEIVETLVGRLDYPMMVVTASDGGRPAGCLVGFASQCSISPQRFAVYLSNKNRTQRVAREAETLGIHFLSSDDGDLAELFGGETSDEIDKFAEIEWHEGAEGTPLIDRCPNRFVGRVIGHHDGGDHVGFVVEPIEAGRGEGFEPLRFQRVKRIDPGHEA